MKIHRVVQGLLAATASALAAMLAALPAHAQVATVAPSSFSLNVATGGAVAGVVAPTPGGVTGARSGEVLLCSALLGGAGPGVSQANPCNPAASLGRLNVGAQDSSSLPRSFAASFTPAQLAAAASALAAAGQPHGSRRFYGVLQYAAVVKPPATARFVTLQFNLIEPPPTPTPPPVPAPVPTPAPSPAPAGITAATASLVDVAPDAPSPVQIRYTIAGADTPLAGQFCSALAGGYPASGIATGNPCAPGSSLGLAGPAVGYTGQAQTGETLVVPETIARQAAARALASGSGVFYFVRQFGSGRHAVVRLRLNGAAANVPLAFTGIRLGFKDGASLQNIGFFKRGQLLPAAAAWLRYRGAGVLRARWEIVQPGDTPPTALDLTAEAALSPLDRARQQRWRVLERVSVYLPAAGQFVLPGPAPRLLPNEQYGQYLLLLRIETLGGMGGAASGAAPFTLPVLRYYVGESSGPNGGLSAAGRPAPEPVSLVAPQAGAAPDSTGPLTFSWLENQDVGLYRLEVEANGKPAYAARVRARGREGINSYTAPPFVPALLAGKQVRWRVVALAGDGQFLGESEWRAMEGTP